MYVISESESSRKVDKLGEDLGGVFLCGAVVCIGGLGEVS